TGMPLKAGEVSVQPTFDTWTKPKCEPEIVCTLTHDRVHALNDSLHSGTQHTPSVNCGGAKTLIPVMCASPLSNLAVIKPSRAFHSCLWVIKPTQGATTTSL